MRVLITVGSYLFEVEISDDRSLLVQHEHLLCNRSSLVYGKLVYLIGFATIYFVISTEILPAYLHGEIIKVQSALQRCTIANSEY